MTADPSVAPANALVEARDVTRVFPMPAGPVVAVRGVALCIGAGDHDRPYRFGWRPRASVPYPFNTRQYARLLVLRGRVQDSLAGRGDLARAA